ncbi:MAG: hypothetical protein EOP56_13320 [Sphingobacteriales bacterium]|nr:MAG: hypothetical protein EOP56_13320 [Sphingobacteriales bacterium]
METALIFELPVAGKEVKMMIDRHCNKDLVFYSVEVIVGEQTKECQFMILDRERSTYNFTPSPNNNSLLEQERSISDFIMQHFHNHCLN